MLGSLRTVLAGVRGAALPSRRVGVVNAGDAPAAAISPSCAPGRDLGRFEPWPGPQLAARRRLARHLHGSGLELGPGHQPFEVPADVRVRFVDRWDPEENRSLFPELVAIGADGGFVEPDVVANFDLDRLRPVESASADFVICSHVLEHLAEPIGFIAEIHRVLRPGGVALMLLPDRRTTFDRDRPPTPLAHLVDEHRRGVTEVDEDHLIEFLTQAGEGASFLGVPEEPTERQRFFDWHRERSIHVHCWSQEEFPAVIAHCIDHLGQDWQLVDLLTVAEEGPNGIEFGYVLRRSTIEDLAGRSGARFLGDWATWFAARAVVDEALAHVGPPTWVTAEEAATEEPSPGPPSVRRGWRRRISRSQRPQHSRDLPFS